MAKIGAIHLIKHTGNKHTASVIFLHGSGDSGKGVLDWVRFLVKDWSLPHVKFIFPTAPLRPYTPLQGQTSNVWFDRYDITPEVPEHVETLESIKIEMKQLIDQEVQAGIPLNRIIVGGFSMGGALALHLAYTAVPGLAGVFALSSFLNNNSKIYNEAKLNETPLFMCHGNRDTMVPIEWGRETFKKLTALGAKGEFKSLNNTLHELKKQELDDLLEWIKKKVPQ